MNNSFLGINDFYNFIRKDNGKNSPTSFYYFSVMFYRENTTTFTGLSNENLERLRFAIQKVELPKSTLKGYENNQLTDAVGNIDNIYGAYTFLKNVYFNTDSKTITMRILNMQYPVIEEVIYPWFYNCVKNEWDNASEYSTSFPKLSMVIRFWGGNTVGGAKTEKNHNSHVFEYFISGLFPINIENYNPAHATNGDDNRSVVFAFNEFRAYLKGNNSTWHPSREYGPPIIDPKTKKPVDTKSLKSSEELLAKKAAEDRIAAEKARQQIQNAHNWLQDVISKAAGASAGLAVKNAYKSNILSDKEKGGSSGEKQSNQNINLNNKINQPINSNKNYGDNLNIKDLNDLSSNVVNGNNKLNNENTDLNQVENEQTISKDVNSNNGTLSTNEVLNILNQERNVSSTDSNMSLEENEILVETMNVDNEFGIILESDDEGSNIQNESKESVTSSSDVNNNIQPLLENDSTINTNKKETTLSKDDLQSSSNIKTNEKNESSLNDIDTSVDVKHTEDEQKTKDEVTIMGIEQLNSISENLELNEISGSVLNIQKFISKQFNDELDVSLQATENEETLSAIKSNMSLEENREMVETITVDDEFGEILESEDEFENVKNAELDELKNSKALQIENEISSISSTIEMNNLNLVKSIEESDLNLNNAIEKYNEHNGIINERKSSLIELKKEQLDNYTSDVLNNEFGSIESKQLTDIINEKYNSIDNIKETSDVNIETLSSNYIENLNHKTDEKNALINEKFKIMENFSTSTNNKNDEVEKIVQKKENLNLNTSTLKKSVKKENENSLEIGETKNDESKIKYLLNNDDANKIYNLLKNNRILNVESYNYLNSYADIKRLDIKDVVREYKSKSNNELDSFIYDLIGSVVKIEINTITNSPLNALQNLTLEKQGYKISKDVTSFEIKNNKIINSKEIDQKITSDDINDLFS